MNGRLRTISLALSASAAIMAGLAQAPALALAMPQDALVQDGLEVLPDADLIVEDASGEGIEAVPDDTPVAEVVASEDAPVIRVDDEAGEDEGLLVEQSGAAVTNVALAGPAPYLVDGSFVTGTLRLTALVDGEPAEFVEGVDFGVLGWRRQQGAELVAVPDGAGTWYLVVSGIGGSTDEVSVPVDLASLTDLSHGWGWVWDADPYLSAGALKAGTLTLERVDATGTPSRLTRGKDFEVVGWRREGTSALVSAPTGTGSWVAVARGIGAYTGELEVIVELREFNDLTLGWFGTYDAAYVNDGAAATLGRLALWRRDVSGTEHVLSCGEDFEVVGWRREGTNALVAEPDRTGAWTVVVRGIGAYSGELELVVTVRDAKDVGMWTATFSTVPYVRDGRFVAGELTLLRAGTSSRLTQGKDFEVVGWRRVGSDVLVEAPDTEGAWVCVVRGIGAYAGEVSLGFTVGGFSDSVPSGGVIVDVAGTSYYRLDGAYVSGFVSVGDNVMYFFEEGGYATGWLDVDGARYRMSEDGVMLRGWQTIGGETYRFGEDGTMCVGWTQVGDARYYFRPDGRMARAAFVDGEDGKRYVRESGIMARGWVDWDSKKLYFDDEGLMVTGWFEVDGRRYYFRESGSMATGFADIDGYKYYFRDSGSMAVGWVQVAGETYRFDDRGHMLCGWQGIDGKKFYFRSSGIMQRGWATLDGKLYYFRDSGSMAVGWATIDGRKYYFRDSGSMAVGWATIDGKKYYFDTEGQMVVGWADIDVASGTAHYYFRDSGSMAVGWATIDGKKYFFRPSGNMATGFADVPEDSYKRYFDEQGTMLCGWQDIAGKRYYFRASGAMQTGTATIDGVSYTFSDSGVLVS